MIKKLLPLFILLIVFSCKKDELESLADISEAKEIIDENEPSIIEEEISENSSIEEIEVEDTFPIGSLNNIFSNALISDKSNNIKRNQPILITAYQQSTSRIKTNYPYLKNLITKSIANQSWFITQNAEASTIIEIKDVNIETGWITIDKTLSGRFDTTIGAKIEFFNPFVNYEIINDSPLFNPYPTSTLEGKFNYIQSGGIITKNDGTYILLTPVVFGTHDKRSIYYATSTNLEDWRFHDKKLISTDKIPFAKKNGNIFSTDNPYKLDNGNYLVLLGVEQPNSNYTSAYMVIDEDLNIVQQPKEIMIPNWNGEDQNSFPLALTYFEGQYRLLLHKRYSAFIDREIHEVIADNLFDALDFNQSIISSKIIHKGTTSTGYLRGKADDATYINYNSQLYILLGSEEVSSSYLTSNNREYGLMQLSDNKWEHDYRSPLLVNPVQLHKKYTNYDWAWDHLGGFVSPIIKNNTLYIYMAFGTDNPDYFLSGIKIPLN